MTQFCLSTTTTTTNSTSHFFTLLLSDFLLFCSFILTHPLYFSYFIFFFPYLLKILSFLSPLFLTTSLLLLALLTISPGLIDYHSPPQDSESKLGFLLTTYHTILSTLRSRLDDETLEFRLFEEFEAFVVVFEASSFVEEENQNEVLQIKDEENSLQAHDDTQYVECLNDPVSTELDCNVEDKMVGFTQKKIEANSLELLTCKVEERKVQSKVAESDKVDQEKQSQAPTKLPLDSEGEFTSDQMENPKKLLGCNLGTCGSMRKEKEWKRTLACKLYEERKNIDGGEGMDLLWEAYEVDSGKVKASNNDKKAKKSEIDYYDDEDDEEEEMDEQLCCLQALRFSTRKMKLGMGKPNLVKFSKALKGIGWFHHISKHGKKGKN